MSNVKKSNKVDKIKNSNITISKLTIVLWIVFIFSIIILQFFLSGSSSSFIRNTRGKKICSQIERGLNDNAYATRYLVSNNGALKINAKNRIWGLTEHIYAFDSEYEHIEENDGTYKDLCHIWIKGMELSDRSYIGIVGDFYLTDKHSAKLSKYGYGNSINTYVEANETKVLTFRWYDYDPFKYAEGVVFESNDYYLPMKDDEYCQLTAILYYEAKEDYNYDYDDYTGCNCNEYYGGKCKIFGNNKIKEYCLQIRELLPTCNNLLKEKREVENSKNKVIELPNNEKDNFNKKTENNAESSSETDNDDTCNNYYDCKTNYQKQTYCRCAEYKAARGKENIILAPQPEECVLFCEYNNPF